MYACIIILRLFFDVDVILGQCSASVFVGFTSVSSSESSSMYEVIFLFGGQLNLWRSLNV
jgi:hypothetical protein